MSLFLASKLVEIAKARARTEARPVDVDTRHFAHALEDLPDEVLDQAVEIAGTQPGLSL